MAKKKAPAGARPGPSPRQQAQAQALETVKESLLQGPAGLPHLSELAEHFIRLQGGPQAVALMLANEWKAAPPGSIARARILEMLLRTWKVAEEKTDHLADLGLLSKQDLDREIDERLKQMVREQEPAVEHDPAKPRWPGAT